MNIGDLYPDISITRLVRDDYIDISLIFSNGAKGRMTVHVPTIGHFSRDIKISFEGSEKGFDILNQNDLEDLFIRFMHEIDVALRASDPAGDNNEFGEMWIG